MLTPATPNTIQPSLWQKVRPKNPLLVGITVSLCMVVMGIGLMIADSSHGLWKADLSGTDRNRFLSYVCNIVPAPLVGGSVAIGFLLAIALGGVKGWKDNKKEKPDPITSSDIRANLYAVGAILFTLALTMIIESTVIHNSQAFSDLNSDLRKVAGDGLDACRNKGFIIGAVAVGLCGLGTLSAVTEKLAGYWNARKAAQRKDKAIEETQAKAEDL